MPKTINQTKADIRFENHGSVALIRPLTEHGITWIEQHIAFEPWQVFGGAISAEPKLVDAVITGAINDGLTLDLGAEC